jgi:hypothetical protein
MIPIQNENDICNTLVQENRISITPPVPFPINEE